MKEKNNQFTIGINSMLNKPGFHATASVAFKSGTDRRIINKKEIFIPNTYGSLSVSDCTRTIILDMDWSNKEEIENTIFKLTQLINTAFFIKNNLYERHAEFIKFKRAFDLFTYINNKYKLSDDEKIVLENKIIKKYKLHT